MTKLDRKVSILYNVSNGDNWDNLHTRTQIYVFLAKLW